MLPDDLIASIVTLRPFVPARDFGESRLFYETIGFQSAPLGEGLAHMQLGPEDGAFDFLLQDYYVKEFAENLMMHLLVTDVDGWWRHISALRLEERFGVRAPREPKNEAWGLRVLYVFDPAGVLWHFAAPL